MIESSLEQNPPPLPPAHLAFRLVAAGNHGNSSSCYLLDEEGGGGGAGVTGRRSSGGKRGPCTKSDIHRLLRPDGERIHDGAPTGSAIFPRKPFKNEPDPLPSTAVDSGNGQQVYLCPEVRGMGRRPRRRPALLLLKLCLVKAAAQTAQFSPQKRASEFQRHMNGVCCYDGARLPVARFGNTVAMETTGGDEGSYRQSADGLWVNPFKHELPLSFFFFFFFLNHYLFLSQPKAPTNPWSYTILYTGFK